VERKRSALDWMALAAEEHGREILEVYLRAMRGGDWRAAEALMSRIYGKPTETVVTHTPPSPARAVLASMTLEEKLKLLYSLQRGEVLDHPVLEASSPSHSSSHELEP
jgi:hypothetical protein